MRESNRVFVSETGKTIIRLRRWVAFLAVVSVLSIAGILAMIATRPQEKAEPSPQAPAIQVTTRTEALQPGPRPVTLDAGVYVAGDDFPAGVYSVSVAEGESSALYYLYQGREAYDQDICFAVNQVYNVNGQTATVGREELPSGMMIRTNGRILLSPYTGLGGI